MTADGSYPQRWRVSVAADGGYPQRWRVNWPLFKLILNAGGQTGALTVLILNAGG
ncbi:hypothetical protein N5933_27220 (plasmid) [Klebsiella pneumoniae]|uniref:hypothetical protein n=1 Tax=Klebsiella pneumoniae TaxID=573 RepID=UPI0021C0CDAA|nr:hypothetical protein [Klebsiella pneumoniae]UXI48848.1 hypothetical protein N5933_27220 [Klebsiella pneumoniae]